MDGWQMPDRPELSCRMVCHAVSGIPCQRRGRGEAALTDKFAQEKVRGLLNSQLASWNNFMEKKSADRHSQHPFDARLPPWDAGAAESFN